MARELEWNDINEFIFRSNPLFRMSNLSYSEARRISTNGETSAPEGMTDEEYARRLHDEEIYSSMILQSMTRRLLAQMPPILPRNRQPASQDQTPMDEATNGEEESETTTTSTESETNEESNEERPTGIRIVTTVIITPAVSSNEDYELLSRLNELVPPVSKAASEETIASLPVSKYSEIDKNDSTTAKTCNICLSDYESDDHVLTLPVCGHLYHQDCITKWLKINKVCPVCKHELE
jgi:E3 ubiquitin-protein ligase BIG BROTHER-like protein